LAYPTIVALSFLLDEIVLWLIFDTKGGWKFRFSSVKNFPHIRPFAKTWKVALVFILIVIAVVPILDAIFWKTIINFLISLGRYQSSILIVSLSLVYIWTTELIMSRKLNVSDLIPIGLIVLTAMITLLIRYYF